MGDKATSPTCPERRLLGGQLHELWAVLADPELAVGIAQAEVLLFGAGGGSKAKRWAGWVGADDAVHVDVGEVEGCEPQLGVVGCFADQAPADWCVGHGSVAVEAGEAFDGLHDAVGGVGVTGSACPVDG